MSISLLRVVVILSLGLFVVNSASAQRVLLKATNLRCEYRVNPLGIDSTEPRLSWELQATDPQARNQKQVAYQIMVGSQESLRAGKPDMWDTGKVTSDATNQIVYSGKELRSGQQVYWHVKVWNEAGEGPVSDTAMWSMGLLKPADWHAKWIGYDAPDSHPDANSLDPTNNVNLDGATWVWFDEGDPRKEAPAEKIYLRKVIEIPGNVAHAYAMMSADNSFHAYVNGQGRLVGADFKQPHAEEITDLLKKGTNVLAIQAENSGGPAGLCGRFVIDTDNGQKMQIDVDKSWFASKKVKKTWQQAGYDTKNWKPVRELAKVGEAPWGNITPKGLVLPPAPYLRSTFNVEKKVRRATAYATALGLYELHLNGQRVGNFYLTPGWTDFHKRVYYNTYDVTKLIQQGKNAIASPLADGWYDGYLGYFFRRHNYGGDPRLRVQVEIEFTDGSKQIVGTDESWKASYGPLREADLLMGCTYDAKREMDGWDTTAFDDSSWQPVVTSNEKVLVQAHPGNPVQIDRTFEPIKITEPKKGVYVFDLGQNMVGWAKFNLRPTPGKPIVVRYSEMLNPDGTPYTVALRSARATDTYWPKSSEPVIWEPQFTFHGFRYVEISGLDYKPGKDAVIGIVVHSGLRQTGDVATSNKLVNQLFHNIIWGQKGNYLEIPTDCPQRDERLGWTGDAQFFVRTGSYNMDVSAFFTKWLVDLVEDSQMKNGGYTHVAPAIDPNDGGATAWQDAAPICTWTMYRFYGDTRIIQSHWASLSRYMKYLHDTSHDLVRNEKPFGDWLNLGGGAKGEVIGTAYYAYVARLMSEMAAAIGKEDESAQYKELAELIREKFISDFVMPDGSIKESSQTGYALAFSMNLIPDDKKQQAAQHFVDEIAKKNWHLATGFIGTPRLLPALTMAGQSDVAYRLLLTDTFPSWLFPVTLGATTMWERWDGWRPDVGFQNPGMNSFNHYAFGSVGQWLYETVAGIQTDGAGFRKIIIKPVPSGQLTWALGKYDSINGLIVSDWKITNGKLTMNVTIPVNTTATVYVPTSDPESVKELSGLTSKNVDGKYVVFEVGSGNYSFTGKF